MVADGPTERDGNVRDARRAAIHGAAVAQFTARGIRATSMANIADAAGMSRPALYQYFRNKDDIFASAFIALFDNHVDRALEALGESGSTAQRLEGFLQRFEGDLWEHLAASPHADEIVSAKNERVSAAVADVVSRLWDGLAAHLDGADRQRTTRAEADRTAGWLAILRLSPAGLKSDQPTIALFRERLTALANSVAADVDRRRTPC